MVTAQVPGTSPRSVRKAALHRYQLAARNRRAFVSCLKSATCRPSTSTSLQVALSLLEWILTESTALSPLDLIIYEKGGWPGLPKLRGLCLSLGRKSLHSRLLPAISPADLSSRHQKNRVRQVTVAPTCEHCRPWISGNNFPLLKAISLRKYRQHLR